MIIHIREFDDDVTVTIETNNVLLFLLHFHCIVIPLGVISVVSIATVTINCFIRLTLYSGHMISLIT